MEDTETDFCHVLAPLGFIWGGVMPQVLAVISSFNEAAVRTADHEKKQTQRQKRGGAIHSLRHFLVLRTDLMSTGNHC